MKYSTMDNDVCVKVLLPALIETPEQEQMTNECRSSLISLKYCVQLEEDNKKYKTKVAGVWNHFFKKWIGKEYDFLMIVANDTIADPMAIDFMVQCALENPSAGIISGHVERDREKFFEGYGRQTYSGELTQGLKDPACFLVRKGVLETIGLADEEFPCEFVERDLIYRAKLAGWDYIEPKEILWFHPPYAGTIGNDMQRLNRALRKYVLKWGGDANAEVYTYPYNDLRFNYKFIGKYYG